MSGRSRSLPVYDRLRARWIALFAALVLGSALGLSPSEALAGAECRVGNITAATNHATLQGAVDAAGAGDVVEVMGTCVGHTNIDRDLVIRGRVTPSSGRPTLKGSGFGRVVTIAADTGVKLIGMTIRDGFVNCLEGLSCYGGGISNNGRLVLRDMVVKRNSAMFGGGISSTGKLRLVGSTIVRANEAVQSNGSSGGGIQIRGRRATLVMEHTAAVSGNVSHSSGSGIHVIRGTATLRDNAVVTFNAGAPGIVVECGTLLGAVVGENVYGNSRPNILRFCNQ